MKVQKTLLATFIVALAVIGSMTAMLLNKSSDHKNPTIVTQIENNNGVLGAAAKPVGNNSLDIVATKISAEKGRNTIDITVTNPTDTGIQFVPGIDLFARGSDGNTYNCRSEQERLAGIIIPKETKTGVIICDTSAFVKVAKLLYQPNNTSQTVDIVLPELE